MTTAAELASGKSDHDENFPVAALFAGRFRQAVLAFYRFVRLADDVGDHPTVPAAEKLRLLAGLRACLMGQNDDVAEAIALRTVLAQRALTPVHASELIVAFERDCTKTRYADWADLMDYCRYSAMPVGRYVLDVHGESRDLWPQSDALCAALQVINHLQDCAKDYRGLNRVYLPQDSMGRHGASVEMLGYAQSPAPLRAVLDDLCRKTEDLLRAAAPFADGIKNARLALDVAFIQVLAEALNARLSIRDPLCQRVHHSKCEMAALFVKAFVRFLVGRLKGKRRPI